MVVDAVFTQGANAVSCIGLLLPCVITVKLLAYLHAYCLRLRYLATMKPCQ
jgi:hypothetical protein